VSDQSDAADRRMIGDRLRQAREYLGFTQQQIADALGLHRPSVSMIEAGERRVAADELQKLALIYSRPVAWFLGGEEGPPCAATRDLLATAQGLCEEDRAELMRFAEYLQYRKRAAAPRPTERVPVDARCPRCDSPSPDLHPAVQHEGEVQPCSHPFHTAKRG